MGNFLAAILLMAFFIAVGCDRSRHSVNGLVIDERATSTPLNAKKQEPDVVLKEKAPMPIISSTLVVRP